MIRPSLTRRDLLLLTVLILPGLATAAALTGDLPRRAEFGARLAEGVVVAIDDEQLSAAGLEVGDTVLGLAGRPPGEVLDDDGLLRHVEAGREVRISAQRDGRAVDLAYSPPPRPLEAIPGVTTEYGVADLSDGSRLRTLVSRPAGAGGRPGVIAFVQWVSCGSLEHREGRISSEILARLARDSGRALLRVERSASGDSRGPDCDELDYDTELSHYVQAFGQLLDRPDLDPRDVVLYGSSLGSTLAPLVARELVAGGVGVRGIVVQGGGGHTYLERMIQFDRQYLERRPDRDPLARHAEMQDRIRFHHAYLVEGRHPDEIARDGGAMAAVRADIRGLGADHHYGRPFAWHQQAARHNVLAAWAGLEVQALVVFNAFDQFEGRHGHQLIVDTVNHLRPGTAAFVELERTGHSNRIYHDIEDAYAWRDGTDAPLPLALTILDWLERRVPTGRESTE